MAQTPTRDGRHGEPGPWWRRGWRRLSAVVLAVGGLAAAIGSVLALWPDPDEADGARFLSTPRVFFPVPLSEFSARVGATDDTGALGWAGAAVVGLGPPEPAVRPSLLEPGLRGPAEVEPSLVGPSELRPTLVRPPLVQPRTATATATTRTAPPATERSTAEPPTVGPRATRGGGTLMTPGVLSPQRALELVAPRPVAPTDVRTGLDDVLPRVLDRAPGIALPVAPSPGEPDVGTETTVAYLVSAASKDPDGAQVPPDVAAERVVDLLGDVRTRELEDGRLEPLGVVIDANLELTGLRNVPVLVSWEVWPQDGAAPLFDAWLQSVAAYELTASSDHDTTAVRLWVPLPEERGSYVARLALFADGAPLAVAHSEPFS